MKPVNSSPKFKQGPVLLPFSCVVEMRFKPPVVALHQHQAAPRPTNNRKRASRIDAAKWVANDREANTSLFQEVPEMCSLNKERHWLHCG